ncbi:MAG TPA: DUF305 domain-containing protein [Candidatus Saccharimonadales bacterium]
MHNKTLLGGIIGFILGGLLVSIAAVTFDKKPVETNHRQNQTTTSHQADNAAEMHGDMSMHDMSHALEAKKGDDYDRAFLRMMIEHHQGAVDMAEMSAAQAKHDELKTFAKEIQAAQQNEISQMKQWQKDWGY